MSLAEPPSPGYAPARSPFSWLLERELMRFLRIWRYSIAGQVLAPVMMLLVFGFALDHRVTEAGGVAYNRFILPGLIAQTIAVCGYTNGTTSLFDARRDRYINDVLASPLRWWDINLACVAAAVIRSMDQNMALQQLVVQPLTFLGGTFYSVSTLPDAWDVVSHLNPVFYGVQIVRIAFLGRADTSTALTLAVLWGLTVVLSAWSLRAFAVGRTLRA